MDCVQWVRMFKSKIWFHQIFLFCVLGFLVLLKVIDKTFIFNLGFLWWLLGAMVGFLFVFLDRFFYSFLSKPDVGLSLRLKESFGQRDFARGVKLLLAEQYEQKELVMRSGFFVIVWSVLAFFTVTSVINMFGRGLILGIGTHIIFDLIYDFRNDPERLDVWFWHVKRTLEPKEKLWFVVGFGVVYMLIAMGLR